jgi:hypothetical protein
MFSTVFKWEVSAMKNQVEERTGQNEEQEACHHYWVIEVANGPTSMGECKYCNERREFQNAFPHLQSPP